MATHYVYVLFSEGTGKFYVGETFNVEERLERHNSGYYDGKWSEKAKPWVLFLSIECENKAQALTIERHIKNMKSRVYLENLKSYPEMVVKLLRKYSSPDC
ncbi:MAG: GIY-YIG nuclease family protein [Bacteroidetes bacterium]|nr:GIY-YIG nuclease family protein [Bacteroidota bacterium]